MMDVSFLYTENSLLTLEVIIILSIIFMITALSLTLYWIIGLFTPSPMIEKLKISTWSWLAMFLIFVLAVFLNAYVATATLAMCSIMAFRELSSTVTLRKCDRSLLKWCYLAILVQYYLACTARYEVFIVFIPVFVFIFLPIRAVIQGETQKVTQSLSVLQWIMMLTVFSFSHIAFLIHQDWNQLSDRGTFNAGNGGLVLFLIFLTQINDIAQYFSGNYFGKHKIVPAVSPNKTWEGFIGGMIVTTITGGAIHFLTPFSVGMAMGVAFLMSIMGFFGDVAISAIKRDYGLKDLGSMIPGHGGIMDRLDSLVFTSLFFAQIIILLG